MVLVNDKKYACEACIKGHRSSACKHTDRPLFEIKKKGRPVTQCEHCRALRKTKQVHIKCVCESKPSDDSTSPEQPQPKPKKGNLQKVLATPAFPDGLPASLGAQVAAAQPSSDGSSDSDQPDVCTCKDTNNCQCVHVKRSHHKRATTSSSTGSAPASIPSSAPHPPALSRMGDLRPVLPRLQPSPPETSASASHHYHRGQHGASFFNPYGRAYKEHVSHPEDLSPSIVPLQEQQELFSDQSLRPSGDYFMPPTAPQTGNEATWGNNNTTFSPSDLQILCGCGDSCTCPGCVQHRGPDAWINGPCTSTDSCGACLICSVNSMPAPTPTPPTTPSVGYAPSSQFDSLDEWMRSTSTSAPTDPTMFYHQSNPDMSSYPAYISSLGNLNTLQQQQGSFDSYALNVFDEGPSVTSQQPNNSTRAMSIDVRSSDGGFSMERLGVSPITRRSSSFSGASPSPREWMPPPHPPPDMGLNDDVGMSYQRPFFSNPKAASTTSLLLPSDVLGGPSLGRSTISRSTTDISSTSAIRTDTLSEWSDELESLINFAAGKFPFEETSFVAGYPPSGEGVGEGNEHDRDNDQSMELANQYRFDRTL